MHYVFSIDCSDYFDDPVEVSQDPTVLHSTATSESESLDSHYVGLDNHLTDTSTIASIEARNAVADSWEDGDSEAQAYQNSLEAIRDYYAVQQINLLESDAKSLIQFTNIADAAKQDDDLPRDYVGGAHPEATDLTTYDGTHWVNNSTGTGTAELVNGSEYEYETAQINFNADTAASFSVSTQARNLTTFDPNKWELQDDGTVELHEDHYLHADGGYDVSDAEYSPENLKLRLAIPNVGDVDDGGLPSETVYNHSETVTRWQDIEDQSGQVISSYDTGFVEALYHELDEGNLDPEDVRGAEGQVRFLSGDADVTDDRFRLATMQMLGMNNPDMSADSSMTVEYEGYTTVSYNGTDRDERVPEYSDHVDDKFAGLMFSDSVPEDGFERNQTYTTNSSVNTSATGYEYINGSAQIFDEPSGETVRFENGTFTVTEMYDADGNEVDRVEWEQPQYDTYDAEEFVEYIEEVQDLREELADRDDDGGWSIGFPSFGDGFDGLGDFDATAVALVIGLVAVLLAAAASSNQNNRN
ncbi:hypothetical protein ACLI4Z_18040 [Natrialbaceae archaeon A-arb3/5]